MSCSEVRLPCKCEIEDISFKIVGACLEYVVHSHFDPVLYLHIRIVSLNKKQAIQVSSSPIQ